MTEQQTKFINYINYFSNVPQIIISECEEIKNDKENFVENITKTLNIKEELEKNKNEVKETFENLIEPEIFNEIQNLLENYTNKIKQISNLLYESKMKNNKEELNKLDTYIEEIQSLENIYELFIRLNTKSKEQQDETKEQKENQDENVYIPKDPNNPNYDPTNEEPYKPMYATIDQSFGKNPGIMPEEGTYTPNDSNNPNYDPTNEEPYKPMYATNEPKKTNQQPRNNNEISNEEQKISAKLRKKMKGKNSYESLKKVSEEELNKIEKRIKELNEIKDRTLIQDKELEILIRNKKELQNYLVKTFPEKYNKKELTKYRDAKIKQLGKRIDELVEERETEKSKTPSKFNTIRKINKEKITELNRRIIELRMKQKIIEKKQYNATKKSIKTFMITTTINNSAKVYGGMIKDSAIEIKNKAQEKLEPQLEKIRNTIASKFVSYKEKIGEFENKLESLRRKRVIAQGDEPIVTPSENTEEQDRTL